MCVYKVLASTSLPAMPISIEEASNKRLATVDRLVKMEKTQTGKTKTTDNIQERGTHTRNPKLMTTKENLTGNRKGTNRRK